MAGKTLYIDWQASVLSPILTFEVPDGFPVVLGQQVDPIVWGWKLFTGNKAGLSTECGIAGPVAGAPVWGPVNPLKFITGQFYQWIVPPSAATAATGQVIVGYGARSLPSFLGAVNTIDGLKVFGIIPADYTGDITLVLYAQQGDGKQTDQTITLVAEQISATDIYALIQVSVGQLILRIGPAGQTAPQVSLMGPAGWSDTTTYSANPAQDVIDAKPYPWYKLWTGVQAGGVYTVKVVYLGQTLYGQFTLQNGQSVLALTTTPSGAAEGYSLPMGQSVAEGTSIQFQLAKKQGIQDVAVPTATYELQGAREGTVLTQAGGVATITVAANAVVNDSYQLTLVGQDGGAVKATVLVNVVDKTPQIIQILRQFDPATQTLYYLVKHNRATSTGLNGLPTGDLDYLPVWRAKRAEEPNWRGEFVASWGGTAEKFSAQVQANYQLYMQANMSIAGQAATNTIVQFKPYPNAPDSAIIQLEYSHGGQDYGTIVYPTTNNDNGGPPAVVDPTDQSGETDIQYQQV